MGLAIRLHHMKIIHANTYDGAGGAAGAVRRLHTGLRNQGVDSHLLVQLKETENPTVHGPNGHLGKLRSKIRENRNYSLRDGSPAGWLVE